MFLSINSFIYTDDSYLTNGILDSSSMDDPYKSPSQTHSRKGRMRFSPEQIQALEQRFQEQQYLLPADRKILAVTLRMTERQVKTWFQNKRAQFKRSQALSQYSVYPFLSTAYTLRMPLPYRTLSTTQHYHSFQLPSSPLFSNPDHLEQKQLFIAQTHSPVVMATPQLIYSSTQSPAVLPINKS